MLKKNYSLATFFLLYSSALLASKSMTIKELLENKDHKEVVSTVQQIDSSCKEQFSKEQLMEFCNLPLEKLHTLNFWKQSNVDDDILKLIAQKANEGPAFRRLKNLDLSETQVTEAGVLVLLKSDYVGTIRDLPQLSGRYNTPAVTIFIRVEDVKAEFPNMTAFNRGDIIKKDITIHYKNPLTDKEIYAPVKGIKMIELKKY